MKKIIFVLILVFYIYLIPSILYIYDDSGNLLKYVVIEENRIKKQVLIPYKTDFKKINISNMGYRDTIIDIKHDTMHIYLVRKPIEEDTLYISGKKINPEIISKKIEYNSFFTALSLSPYIYIRRYSRSISYSIEGSSSEQVLLAINNRPIYNPVSSIIDFDMFPVLGVSEIEVNKLNSNIIGKNAFSGIINFNSYLEKKIDFFINSDIYGALNYGILFALDNISFNYEKFEKSDIILPVGDFLEHSSKFGSRISLMTKNEFSNFYFLCANTHTEDPGIEGSIFNNGDLYQNLKHYQLNLSYSDYIFHFILNNNFIQYVNNELNIDDYSKSTNLILNGEYVFNDYIVGISSEFNNAKGSKIDDHNKYANSIYLNFGNNKYFYNIKISYPFTFDFNLRRIKKYKNFSSQYGIKFSQREPTFNELYWSGDVFAQGNPDLKNEKKYSIFYDLFFNKFNLSFSIKTGIAYLYDLIYWLPVDGIYTPINEEKVWNFSSGIYADYNLKTLKINNYILFSPYIVDKNNYMELYKAIINNEDIYIGDKYAIMRYKPILSIGNNISIDIFSFNIFINSEYRSKRYVTVSNTKYLDSYFIINAIGINYNNKIAKISVFINNPLNIEIEDIRGYMVEGRTYNFNIKMEVK